MEGKWYGRRRGKATGLLAVVVAMGMVVAACGSSSSDSGGAGNASGTAAGGEDTSAAAGVSADSGGASATLERIKSTGTMTVGVRFSEPPYGYVPQGKSEPIGFSVDLSTAVAKHLGADKVTWVEVTAQNRIPYLTSGKVDMVAASMLIKPDRAEKVAFTIPGFRDVNKMLVEDGSSIKDVDDLTDKTVGVTQGAAQKQDVEKAAPGVTVQEFQTWPLALTAMFNGQIDAVVATTGILLGLEQTANDAGKNVKIVGSGFSPGYIAPAVQKDDPALLKAVNDALLATEEDGTYAEIFKKWWGDAFDEAYHVHEVPAAELGLGG